MKFMNRPSKATSSNSRHGFATVLLQILFFVWHYLATANYRERWARKNEVQPAQQALLEDCFDKVRYVSVHTGPSAVRWRNSGTVAQRLQAPARMR